jgi:hypothetical protein
MMMGRACTVSAICIDYFLLLTLVAITASSCSSQASGETPQVYFDSAPVVACQDVTVEEFAAANPDEKLVEARIQVSSLIRSGREGDLLQYFYRVESPQQTVRIVDYAPKTTLASDMAGNVSIEKKEEQTRGMGVSLSGLNDLPVKVAGSGDIGAKSTDSVRYELVPLMKAVAASGTIHRGRGVYFKLKPSRSTSLEGEKEFSIVLRVSSDWRGDYVYLSCTAMGIKRSVVPSFSDNVICGKRRFTVALHIEGDAAAKAAAERLVQAEADLLQSISANYREIQQSRYPTIAHKVGGLLDVVKPAVPDNWAQTVIYGGRDEQIEQIAQHLPSTVRHAVSRYALARHEFVSLVPRPVADLQ